MTRAEYLVKLANERVLVLDGAMGTMIQRIPLEAADVSYGGSDPAFGCNEILNLTRSDIVFDIHHAYLSAGADIIETNTFGANAFSLAEYGLSHYVYDINLAAVEIARAAVEAIEEEQPEKYAFIAGVVGPTGKSASFSPSVDDPAFREIIFDDFVQMYTEQIRALIDGGVDLLLIETVFDTLVAKAAVVSAFQVMKERSIEIPIMVSATFSDKSNRTLSGQTLEALIDTLAPYPLFSLGVNCSTGAKEMIPLIRRLSELSPFRTSAHPNAGFPDRDGVYRQTPEDLVQLLAPELKEGRLSIVGGCCGTTEHHIAAISRIARDAPPRVKGKQRVGLQASGLEPLEHSEGTMIVIGERTNVAGSRKFARLIRERKFDQALSIARKQIDEGAAIIDICMDDPMIDPVETMVTFLRLASAEPDIARVPFMIDSSNWVVIESALKEVQGRAIVNSISLKEGEQRFIERARHIARMGAAMVVMLFDEQGQADTYERRCTIADRAYRLLIDGGICRPEDIIFDPNVLAIATGMDEHDRYASDFIRAVSWISNRFPRVSISGGVSNLSFSFRGNNGLREAIHALFLEYARQAGLTMAITNPSTMLDPTAIPEELSSLIRRVLLAESEPLSKARDELIELASKPVSIDTSSPQSAQPGRTAWRSFSTEQRVAQALIIGDDSHLVEDLLALDHMSAVSIIEGPLMEGMSKVGTLFGEGKLFLPQVVRSARVMKRAVDILRPRLADEQVAAGESAGTVVLATVKGDVHDIGKNIVSLVLSCNNFRIVDLGVMVEAESILQAVIEEHAALVGLSGLITPSLTEMARVCRLFHERGLQVPIMVGGATTSEEHTAIKLSHEYPLRVFHSTDASHAVSVARKLCSDTLDRYARTTYERYEQLSQSRGGRVSVSILPMEETVNLQFMKSQPAPIPEAPGIHVVDRVPLEELIRRINWSQVAAAWKVPVKSDEAAKLRADGEALLNDRWTRGIFSEACKAVVGVFPARRVADNSIVISHEGEEHRLDFLRMQTPGADGLCRSLADYVHRDGDFVGMFVATAGRGVDAIIEGHRRAHDDYTALLVQMIADRLAEAFSEYLEEQIATVWWNIGDRQIIRPAIGYPSAPDHAQKRLVFSLLDPEQRIGVRLTEGLSMHPASSVSGLYFVGKGCNYFSLGPVGTEQMKAYAKLKQVSLQSLERTMQVRVVNKTELKRSVES